MRLNTTEEEIKNEKNRILLEEDDMELQINYVEKIEDIYRLNTRAIIEGEAYNNFEVEVKLVENVEINCVSEIIEQEWEWYDILI